MSEEKCDHKMCAYLPPWETGEVMKKSWTVSSEGAHMLNCDRSYKFKFCPDCGERLIDG